MRKSWLVAVIVIALVATLGGFGIYHFITGTSMGLALGGSTVSSQTLAKDLESSDRDLVMASLDTLTRRNDTAGQPQARKLLASADDYIWFNAALYLGAINDQQAVPYLIKGLKHPASRAYPDVARDLKSLTGQNLGTDQAKWLIWWKQRNPNSAFSFAYATLDNQAAEIQTGSTILINRVIDPVTISYSGSPIALIGVRVKTGVTSAQAHRLVETCILGQFAEIKRDDNQLIQDGSVPAMVYWVADTINGPNLAASLRQGLPPVPFSKRTNVQGYLLQSGLYELDVSSVGDPAIRTELQRLSPTTMPSVSPP